MIFTWGEMFWPHQYLTWKLTFYSFISMSLLPDRISKGVTVAIVCDRVIALTAPLRYKIICRPMRITAIIVAVFVVTSLTTLPTIVDVIMFDFSSSENRTIHTDIGKQYRTFRLSQSTLKPIHIMINFLLFDCLSILIVFVCNNIIIFSLRKRNILASTTSEVQRQRKLQERKLTKLLLTISMLFFFLTGPSMVYRVLFVAGMTPSATITVIVGNLHQTLSLSNSAINFVVYVVMNKKYREGYLAIICCSRRTNSIEDP